MQADSANVDRPHAVASGANAYVTTLVPSSSAHSGSRTRRTGWPSRRRLESRLGEPRDHLQRPVPSSSTTPKPNGTGPRYPGGRVPTAVKRRSVARGPTKVLVDAADPQYGQVSAIGKCSCAHASHSEPADAERRPPCRTDRKRSDAVPARAVLSEATIGTSSTRVSRALRDERARGIAVGDGRGHARRWCEPPRR